MPSAWITDLLWEFSHNIQNVKHLYTLCCHRKYILPPGADSGSVALEEYIIFWLPFYGKNMLKDSYK